MKRISEDVSERLDYVPGVFRVERHVRGVWACKCCAHLRQEVMPAQIIESGIPTARLLAQVLIAKYDDHLPLYRQNEIYARSGVEISGSTLADWVRLWAMTATPRSSRWVAGRMCGASSLSCMWHPRARWRKRHWRISGRCMPKSARLALKA